MPPPDPPRTARPDSAAAIAAIIVLVVAVTLSTLLELSPIDDAYITLRYATNWATGLGLCFNPGERVEGYTNFLLLLIEAAVIRAGADPDTTLSTVGFLSLAMLAWGITRFIVRNVYPNRAAASAPLGLAICLHPVLMFWAASGMETCLYAMLLWFSITTSIDGSANSRRAVSTGLLLTLAAMTRPEAVVFLPVTAIALRNRAASVKPAVLHCGIFVVTFGAYFAVRARHFGYLFPNTFYAKLDYGGGSLALRGLTYVGDFAVAAAPLTLAVVAVVWAIRGSPSWVKVFLATVALHLAVVIYEGGDHFAMFRFVAPIVPFLCVLASYPFTRVRARDGRTTATLAVALVALSAISVALATKRNETPTTSHVARFQSECRCARTWSQIGEWFRDIAPPDASLATIAIGAIGYHSGLTIIDPYALIDPVIAHQPRELGANVAGHEKFDANHVLSKRPGYLLLANLPTPAPAREDALRHVVWGAFNRAMIDNPALAEHYVYRTFGFHGDYLNVHVRRDIDAANHHDRQETNTDLRRSAQDAGTNHGGD